jgi:hypothetical protein
VSLLDGALAIAALLLALAAAFGAGHVAGARAAAHDVRRRTLEEEGSSSPGHLPIE